MPRRFAKRLEHLLCLALLGLLGAAAFLPVIVSGKVPADVEAIFAMPPWQEAALPALEAGGASTDALHEYAWYAFLNHAASFKDPKALLWNPLEGCGTPFLALWRTRCLSPFSLPFYVLPLAEALCVSLWLKLAVAGWCAFYAARRLGYAVPLAFAVAVAFEFSGHLALWCGRPLGDVLPWLPLLFVNVERLAIGQTTHWPLGALVVAIMALGGEPEAVAGALIFALVYLVLRAALARSPVRSAAGGAAALCAAGVLGVGLVGIQVAPYVELLREAGSMGTHAPSTRLLPQDLVVCFLPNFFGQAEAVKLLHFGFIPVCLLPLWLAVRSFVEPAQRRRIKAMLWAVVIMTAAAMLWGRIFENVPVMRLLGPQHFLMANALVLALAAAAAGDEWLALNAEQCKSALLRLLIAVPVLLAAAALCGYANRHALNPLTTPLWLQLLVAAALFVSVLALLALTLLRPSLRTMGYGLAGLTLLSLIWAFGLDTKYVDRGRFFPETDLIKALRATGERISGGDALARWPLAANRVPQTRNPSGVVLRRQAAFLERARQDPRLFRRIGSSNLLLTRQDVQGAFAALRPSLSIAQVFPSGAVIFNDPNAKPRAWVAYEGRSVAAFDASALRADAPPLIEGAAAPAGPAGLEAVVAIREGESPAHLAITVDSPRAGVLVLADTYYPGWKAAVDGEQTPVFPVDGMFRGIHIKEGPHQVAFYYDPFSVRLGLYITLAAAVIVLIQMRHLVFKRIRGG